MVPVGICVWFEPLHRVHARIEVASAGSAGGTAGDGEPKARWVGAAARLTGAAAFASLCVAGLVQRDLHAVPRVVLGIFAVDGNGFVQLCRHGPPGAVPRRRTSARG